MFDRISNSTIDRRTTNSSRTMPGHSRISIRKWNLILMILTKLVSLFFSERRRKTVLRTSCSTTIRTSFRKMRSSCCWKRRAIM